MALEFNPSLTYNNFMFLQHIGLSVLNIPECIAQAKNFCQLNVLFVNFHAFPSKCKSIITCKQKEAVLTKQCMCPNISLD